MTKTIKVIDLLNKIANGEEVPEKIKYVGKIWRIGINSNCDRDYITENEDDALFFNYLNGILIECLNDNIEVIEIIEEQQDIDIQEIEDLPQWVTRRDGEVTQQEGKRLEMAEKINKLVQAVKQLDKNIKDKE